MIKPKSQLERKHMDTNTLKGRGQLRETYPIDTRYWKGVTKRDTTQTSCDRLTDRQTDRQTDDTKADERETWGHAENE